MGLLPAEARGVYRLWAGLYLLPGYIPYAVVQALSRQPAGFDFCARPGRAYLSCTPRELPRAHAAANPAKMTDGKIVCWMPGFPEPLPWTPRGGVNGRGARDLTTRGAQNGDRVNAMESIDEIPEQRLEYQTGVYFY